MAQGTTQTLTPQLEKNDHQKKDTAPEQKKKKNPLSLGHPHCPHIRNSSTGVPLLPENVAFISQIFSGKKYLTPDWKIGSMR
jgi:hypothetical protein